MRSGQNNEALDYINHNSSLLKSAPSIAEYFAAYVADLTDGYVQLFRYAPISKQLSNVIVLDP
jgi:hypothetical protein